MPVGPVANSGMSAARRSSGRAASKGRGQESAFHAPPPVDATETRARHTTFAAPGLNRRERFFWMVCRRVFLAKTNDSAQDPTSVSAYNRYSSRGNY
jgi:alkanesulfonate monooxygenase SsuD/methylene tetrahydromethanopterin reductase-like flavin-dependent oxidoreductase (luciferase family)